MLFDSVQILDCFFDRLHSKLINDRALIPLIMIELVPIIPNFVIRIDHPA